ncbi:glycosyl hydrolase family 8 [Acuticoccus mangrovi]|uniref:Glucanase n=1 Tax=Acuticoccus mangrovi TaxID=2796142 RepID=A0A934MGG8_9HYPH|nr:glycosyl hydrolase family 8 [Acuticoccus mangrovi]MBJ3775915.1 hypothetical protein [Acuticoccus mangrovi]
MALQWGLGTPVAEAMSFQSTARPIATGEAPHIRSDEWNRFVAAFVTNDGRVVDRENGRQSHSEGQGYGMLLALEAGDRETFQRIWQFTKRELQIRGSDALFSWRWLPAAEPHVTDRNNASDGDILIAYALLKAALTWDDRGYAHEADRIIDDIGSELIARVDGRPVLRPAAFGFDDMAGNPGPVVNLSYYIYDAFPLFQVVRPEYPWRELMAEGLRLTDEAGRGGLVPDWVAVSPRGARIANGFAAKSSYDAVRIPLYIMLGGQPSEYLRGFDDAWNAGGLGYPVDYHFGYRSVVGEMKDPGYRMIAALAACARRGAPIPAALQTFRPTTYFASSLHLLGLVVARRDHAECLGQREAQASTIYLASRSSPGYTPRSSRQAPRTGQGVARSGQRTIVFQSSGAASFSDRIMRKFGHTAR